MVNVGVSHHAATVAIRERLAFGDHELDAVYSAIAGDPRIASHELVIVSTCNRTELYAASDSGREGIDVNLLTSILTRGRIDLPLQGLQLRESDHAVRHLCRVAAGLDSMVTGESEVLGQVARAHRHAASAGATGPVLDAVFTTALRAGRRARAETNIGRQAASVSTEAVRVLRDIDPQLAGRSILIVGTGAMARLAGAALNAAGATDIVVISRTTEHAQALAGAFGARAKPWHELTEALARADIVLSSTGAPHTVLTTELVQAAIRNGPRSRVIVDIAVPRDVDPEVGRLEGVRLLDMDELQARVSANQQARSREAPAVERIIDEELERFGTWQRGMTLRPLLTELHASGERVRQRELERAFRRLGNGTPEVRAELERLSTALVSSLLDIPSRRLRAESDPDRMASLTELARTLFGVDAPRKLDTQ